MEHPYRQDAEPDDMYTKQIALYLAQNLAQLHDEAGTFGLDQVREELAGLSAEASHLAIVLGADPDEVDALRGDHEQEAQP